MINLIVARSSNNIIGKDNELIWKLPGDLKRFKDLTSNNSIIMGRKTYESIGRPLPNRKNIVLTRKDIDIQCVTVNNINDAIKEANVGEIFVIGGTQIYHQFIDLDLVDKIYLTQIHKDYEGDSHFIFDESKFTITEEIEVEENGLKFSYLTYSKNI